MKGYSLKWMADGSVWASKDGASWHFPSAAALYDWIAGQKINSLV
jgi:hypothetical protein